MSKDDRRETKFLLDTYQIFLITNNKICFRNADMQYVIIKMKIHFRFKYVILLIKMFFTEFPVCTTKAECFNIIN